MGQGNGNSFGVGKGIIFGECGVIAARYGTPHPCHAVDFARQIRPGQNQGCNIAKRAKGQNMAFVIRSGFAFKPVTNTVERAAFGNRTAIGQVCAA